MVAWAALLGMKAALEREVQIREDSSNPSASNFTVMVEDFPKKITREQLQDILNDYALDVRDLLVMPKDPNLDEHLQY